MEKSRQTSLLSFLQDSPTPFHACSNIAKKLLRAGFEELSENTPWQLLQAQGQYFVRRNDSSIIAFRLGENISDAMTMIGAHTDSPCLKPKPNAMSSSHGYLQCQVSVYGGALLNPWFDRDLSLAGKVVYQDQNGNMAKAFIDIKKPIATIPSLAIHLDRNANNEHSINAQLHLPPLLSAENAHAKNKDAKPSIMDLRQHLQQLIEQQEQVKSIKVLDFDLCFYDTQAPAIIGLEDDLLASARLDNLLSCFCALEAITSGDTNNAPALIICTDHEEVGSQSHCGAQGSFLADVLNRIHPEANQKTAFIRNSIMYSVDNAHAIHPNYADKHDQHHAPMLNNGIVIKHNANQRYATNAESAAITRRLCLKHHIALQDMVVRNDMACGSTIGPITSAEIGICTVDIGIPQLAMHSIRELANINDVNAMIEFLTVAIADTKKSV